MGQIMQFVMISITLAGKGQDYTVCNDFNNFGKVKGKITQFVMISITLAR